MNDDATSTSGPVGSPVDRRVRPSAEDLESVLRELDDTTNQTLRVKRQRWAALVRAQASEITTLRAAVKSLCDAQNAVRAAQVRVHGDGKTLWIPIPFDYADEMKLALEAEAALYALLDTGPNVLAQRRP